MLFAHRTPPTASLIYPVVLRVRGYSVDVLYRASDELGFYILYTPLYHLYRHLQPQTLIILKILGRPVFGGKEKGTVQSLHMRQPLSYGLSSLDCELVP